LVKAAVPVSVTVAPIETPLPRTTVAGDAVADDENASAEFTTMLATASFQCHICQAELKTPTRTRNVPDAAGVNDSV
jgi:hypothetical protein